MAYSWNFKWWIIDYRCRTDNVAVLRRFWFWSGAKLDIYNISTCIFDRLFLNIMKSKMEDPYLSYSLIWKYACKRKFYTMCGNESIVFNWAVLSRNWKLHWLLRWRIVLPSKKKARCTLPSYFYLLHFVDWITLE